MTVTALSGRVFPRVFDFGSLHWSYSSVPVTSLNCSPWIRGPRFRGDENPPSDQVPLPCGEKTSKIRLKIPRVSCTSSCTGKIRPRRFRPCNLAGSSLPRQIKCLFPAGKKRLKIGLKFPVYHARLPARGKSVPADSDPAIWRGAVYPVRSSASSLRGKNV